MASSELSKIDYRNTSSDKALLDKVFEKSKRLGEIVTVNAGVKMYEKGKGTPSQTKEIVKEKPFSIKDSCPSGWKPLYRGKDIGRFRLKDASEYVNYGAWLAAPRSPDLFESPKILMRRTDDILRAVTDETGAIAVNSCHIIKFRSQNKYSYKYLLALLNSKLLQRIFEIQNPQMVNKVFAEVKVVYVERLPFREINLSVSLDKKLHDQLTQAVDNLLDSIKGLKSSKTPQDKKLFQRQIVAVDRQIDQMVYELYALNPEEIAIVESSQ